MDTLMTSTSSAFVPPSGLPRSSEALATHDALAGFFRGFGFTQPGELSRLAAWVLGARPVEGREAALALARERMEAWFAGALGPAQAASGALLVRGRAAFVLCDGARLGAAVLMTAPAALPAAFTRALQAAVPVPAPRPVPTAMPEQSLTPWSPVEQLRRWWRAGSPGVSVSR